MTERENTENQKAVNDVGIFDIPHFCNVWSYPLFLQNVLNTKKYLPKLDRDKYLSYGNWPEKTADIFATPALVSPRNGV